jgi:hypothetical protein
MTPEITQFDIIQSQLLKQLKKTTNVNLCNKGNAKLGISPGLKI